MRPDRFPESHPGNFIHVQVPNRDRFFLRRPFSIFDCTAEKLSLLILERGEGTRQLRKAPVGSQIEFLGPLGNAFPAMPDKRIVAVAGGVGLAPLYYLARTAGTAGITLIYGGRARDDLFLDSIDLEGTGALLATDDGSYGFYGSAVGLAEKIITERGGDVMFSCGPHGMLTSAARLADKLGIPHHVSLENRMACGFGVCRSCVIQTTGLNGAENKTVCHDGPVFDASAILWDKLPVP
jgi:dihydroorotate dehydrogenase electron transfer subunit